jgi:ArsR family metal-binding transcriptional regulator
MTRAVIKLNNDIGTVMPRISSLIEGCAYNPEAKLMAFRLKNITVRVDPHQINIDHIEDEKMVKTFMDWFISLVNSPDEK